VGGGGGGGGGELTGGTGPLSSTNQEKKSHWAEMPGNGGTKGGQQECFRYKGGSSRGEEREIQSVNFFERDYCGGGKRKDHNGGSTTHVSATANNKKYRNQERCPARKAKKKKGTASGKCTKKNRKIMERGGRRCRHPGGWGSQPADVTNIGGKT